MNKPKYLAAPDAVAICPGWTEAVQRWVKTDALGYNNCGLTFHLHSQSGRTIRKDALGLSWFEFDVAIDVEDAVIAIGDQMPHQRRADETGPAGNQDALFGHDY